jgi:hypothetical protein
MANRDFMTDYQRGNAHAWGRISGESQTLRSGLKSTVKHGSLYKKFENDESFQKFYKAETTDKKIKVIKDVLGKKTMAPFDEYSFEDYDRYFKKHMAVMPEEPVRSKVVQPYVDREQQNYDEMEARVDAVKKQASQEYAQYFNEMNWLKAISPNLEFKPFGSQKEVS